MPTLQRLGNAAVARQDRAQRRHQGVDRILRRVAVHPRVQVARAGADAHVEGGEPAGRDRERRQVPVLHAAVEDHARIGAAVVLLEELDDRLAADLLLAVRDDANVDRQRAVGCEQTGRVQQHPELALVVGDAAGVDPFVANRRLERVGLPELERRRRLHVEVAVAEDRRRTRGVGRRSDLADDERSLPVRDRARPRRRRAGSSPRPTPRPARHRPGAPGRRSPKGCAAARRARRTSPGGVRSRRRV